jgi:hypothetical protein
VLGYANGNMERDIWKHTLEAPNIQVSRHIPPLVLIPFSSPTIDFCYSYVYSLYCVRTPSEVRIPASPNPTHISSSHRAWAGACRTSFPRHISLRSTTCQMANCYSYIQVKPCQHSSCPNQNFGHTIAETCLHSVVPTRSEKCWADFECSHQVALG